MRKFSKIHDDKLKGRSFNACIGSSISFFAIRLYFLVFDCIIYITSEFRNSDKFTIAFAIDSNISTLFKYRFICLHSNYKFGLSTDDINAIFS